MPRPDLLTTIFADISLPQEADVLDVGCRNAQTLAVMREKLHLSGGRLIGLDRRNGDFADKASQVALGVELIQADASEPLPFPDGSFDLIFHKDTLECIPDISSHIRELHRMLKSDGIVVCVHRDWETIALNGSNKTLINKVIYEYANFLQSGWMDSCDGWIGRRLWGHFHKTGLFDGTIDCYSMLETEYVPGQRGWSYVHNMDAFIGGSGFLTQEEYDELLGDVAATAARGEYLFSAPFYIYKGRKR